MDNTGKQNDSRLPLRLNAVCTSSSCFAGPVWSGRSKNPLTGERAGLGDLETQIALDKRGLRKAKQLGRKKKFPVWHESRVTN